MPAMFAPFAECLVEKAEVQPGSVVLEVACGTGAVSRAAARRAGASGSVTSVDLGEPTLAVARSRPSEPGAAPIAYVQSDAGSLPLADDAFDVAMCQQGLQFFPDAGAAARMAGSIRSITPVPNGTSGLGMSISAQVVRPSVEISFGLWVLA